MRPKPLKNPPKPDATEEETPNMMLTGAKDPDAGTILIKNLTPEIEKIIAIRQRSENYGWI